VTFSRPVLAVIGDRVVNTLLLMIAAIFVAVAFGILLGALAALRPGSLRDTLLVAGSMALTPRPVLARPDDDRDLLGQARLVSLRRADGGRRRADNDRAGPRHRLASRPAGRDPGAYLPRALSAADARCHAGAGRSDYIRTALAKGLSRRRIIWRHMARNAVLPVATMIGLQASALLGGSVVIETVFAVPGMGRLAYEAVAGRDLPLLMA